MAHDANILIVGAGPTGLSAAVELARGAIKARIVDRKDGPTPLSKAVGVSPHSLHILEPSGVTEQLLAESVRVRSACFHYEDKQLAKIDFSIVPHRFKFLLALLPQSETKAIMADALAKAGVEVEWNTTLVGPTRTRDYGASPTFSSPTGPMGPTRRISFSMTEEMSVSSYPPRKAAIGPSPIRRSHRQHSRPLSGDALPASGHIPHTDAPGDELSEGQGLSRRRRGACPFTGRRARHESWD